MSSPQKEHERGRPSLRLLVYVAAALALVVGAAVYSMSEQEHDHEESGWLEGDAVKVAVVGGVLAVIAVVSLVYLTERPPEEV